MTPNPLTSKKYLLEKFPGKGGWTYIALPEIKQEKDKYFGMLQVHAEIDGYRLPVKTLMPKGDGTLFFPVNAAIRKTIGKGEGDYVHLKLFPVTPPAEKTNVTFSTGTPFEIPEEIIACFKTEPPEVYKRFLRLKTDKQRQWLQWVYEVRQEDARAERILKMIDNFQHSTP
ncbi:DUF1905 domain-containing protein [Sinomicrobium pectinilyticum]|uniref:DUF1905 domain-containing protein n=1 Tax=Sinomicrobium pectinilyticum TaxID=1084421 RepID=A0A3N0F4L7_SINP1|nr:YdeI/OmpD-associated family protein [Sinomicrobium pectinilyticum]RNL95070.1 DUF1905 domain-containing protein [Sinomicrobium pectinilyticum]